MSALAALRDATVAYGCDETCARCRVTLAILDARLGRRA